MLDTDTSVSTMQAYCSQDECILLSTATNDMMPVAYKNSKELPGLCTVVDINIIHDCQPRKLPQVTAKLEQNSFDKYYYLRVSFKHRCPCCDCWVTLILVIFATFMF